MCDMTHQKQTNKQKNQKTKKTNRIISQRTKYFPVKKKKKERCRHSERRGILTVGASHRKPSLWLQRIRFELKNELKRDREQEVNNDDAVRNASVTLNPVVRVLGGMGEGGWGGGG